MKKVIRFFSVLLCLLFTSGAYAQFKFGLSAGLNLNKIHAEPKGGTWETKFNLGYRVGANALYVMSPHFEIQSGALFILKGTAYNLEKVFQIPNKKVTTSGYARRSLTYLEIPLKLAFTIKHFQISAGPYIAFGLSGREKFNYRVKVDGNETKINYEATYKVTYKPRDCSYDRQYFRGLDYGGSVGIGYNLARFRFNVDYTFGLKDITPEIIYPGNCIVIDPNNPPPGTVIVVPNSTLTNRVIGLTIMYTFSRK